MTPPPLRIVHYLDHFRFDAGGVCRAVMDVCALLSSRGHLVTLVTQDDTDVPAEWKAEGGGLPRAVHLPHPNRADAARLLEGADALHLHGMWTTTNLPFAAAARRVGVPYVFSPHGMLDDWCMNQRTLKKRLYLTWAGRGLLERARLVLFAARAELDQSRRWLGRARGAVAPLVLDLSPFRAPRDSRGSAALAPLEGRAFILFLGRLHPIKRVEMLIDAFASLRGRGLGAHLAVAGSGDPVYEAQLRSRADRLGLSGVVHFLGMVVGDGKVSLLRAADLLALPSRHENFGFAAFEALAAGTPVVSTRNVCTWPELDSSGGGLICEDGVEPMATAMQALAADPARAARMGEAGQAWTLGFFDPATVGERYEAAYTGRLVPG